MDQKYQKKNKISETELENYLRREEIVKETLGILAVGCRWCQMKE